MPNKILKQDIYNCTHVLKTKSLIEIVYIYRKTNTFAYQFYVYIYIYIYIITSNNQHGYPWPSLDTPPYRPLLPVSTQSCYM